MTTYGKKILDKSIDPATHECSNMPKSWEFQLLGIGLMPCNPMRFWRAGPLLSKLRHGALSDQPI